MWMLGLDGGKWTNVEDLLLDLRVEQGPDCSVGKPPQGSWTGCSSERICFPKRVNQSFPFPRLLLQLPKPFRAFSCHSLSVLSMVEVFSLPKRLVRGRHLQGLEGQSQNLTRSGFFPSLWEFFSSLLG